MGCGMNSIRTNTDDVKSRMVAMALSQYDELSKRESKVVRKLDKLTANPLLVIFRMMTNDSSDINPLYDELEAIRRYKKMLCDQVAGLDVALVIREAESVGA